MSVIMTYRGKCAVTGAGGDDMVLTLVMCAGGAARGKRETFHEL